MQADPDLSRAQCAAAPCDGAIMAWRAMGGTGRAARAVCPPR
jgi:hypothetical protein